MFVFVTVFVFLFVFASPVAPDSDHPQVTNFEFRPSFGVGLPTWFTPLLDSLYLYLYFCLCFICICIVGPWLICSKRSSMSGRTAQGRQQSTWFSCNLNESLSPACKKSSSDFIIHQRHNHKERHLDGVKYSFDILVDLFIVHLILSWVWDAYSNLLKQRLMSENTFQTWQINYSNWCAEWAWN